MGKKAKKFVALLYKKFLDAGLNVSEWDDLYKSAVDSLKEGKLKTDLVQNVKLYKAEVERNLSSRSEDIDLSREDSDVPSGYKLSCHRVAERLDTVLSDSQDILRWNENLLKVGWNSKLLCPKLRGFCCLLCGKSDHRSLLNSMMLTLREIQDKAEECLTAEDIKRSGLLQKELCSLLIFYHLKHLHLLNRQTDDPILSKQKYEDVMASLLSIYVDLAIVVNRSAEDRSTVATKLCGFVSQVLAQYPMHVVDVLLQLSALISADAAVVLPLARKCLNTPPNDPTNEVFTKYVIAGRTIVSHFGGEAFDIQQVIEAVKAPKHYLNWIREKQPDLLENLPEDRKFRGRIITRFLLHEAEQELIDGLLNIVTENIQEPVETSEICEPFSSNEERVQQTDVNISPVPNEGQLFFVDKRGSHQKPVISNSDVPGDQAGSEPTSVPPDQVEVIEVDLSLFNLDQRQENAGLVSKVIEEDESSDADGEDRDEGDVNGGDSDGTVDINTSDSSLQKVTAHCMTGDEESEVIDDNEEVIVISSDSEERKAVLTRSLPKPLSRPQKMSSPETESVPSRPQKMSSPETESVPSQTQKMSSPQTESVPSLRQKSKSPEKHVHRSAAPNGSTRIRTRSFTMADSKEAPVELDTEEQVEKSPNRSGGTDSRYQTRQRQSSGKHAFCQETHSQPYKMTNSGQRIGLESERPSPKRKRTEECTQTSVETTNTDKSTISISSTEMSDVSSKTKSDRRSTASRARRNSLRTTKSRQYNLRRNSAV